MVAEQERLAEVISDAEAGLFAGQCTDTEALNLAVQRGLVELWYPPGVAGFLGLAKLRLPQS